MRKKFITTALVAAMSIATILSGSSVGVSAAEKLDYAVEKVETSEVSGSDDTDVSKKVQEKALKQRELPKISIDESEKLGEFASNASQGISLLSSDNSVTETFSGFLTSEGQATYLLLTLAPGEILQATLAGPNDAEIDYDVLLYTYDGSLGSNVAGCGLETYINKYSETESKSVEDAISYINTSTENQSFALIVLASSGYSSTEAFNLTVSIDEEGYYDDYEPNDNPFNAISISTGQKVTGCNLNVANDQDWFVWQVPSTISGVKMTLSNSDYAVEMYTATDYSMVLVKPNSSGAYNLNSGYYYIRVHNKSDEFVSSDYTLTFQPYGNTAARMQVSFSGDQGSSKVNYGYGSLYRAKSLLTPTVTVLDSSGYPVPNKAVTLVWQSGSWSEDSGNFQRDDVLYTNSNGQVTFSLSLPPSTASKSCVISGAKIFEHYFDISAMGVFCGDLSNIQNIYHFAYSSYVGG